VSDRELATLFHDAYERLAPSYGYETRPDTRHFDPTTPNGRLMIAVAGEVKTHLLDAVKAELPKRWTVSPDDSSSYEVLAFNVNATITEMERKLDEAKA
jgi:hypothetical protein